MKFSITFKTPDAVEEAIYDHTYDDNKQEEMRALTDKFVRYGELITVEFDTETGTATVVPVKR